MFEPRIVIRDDWKFIIMRKHIEVFYRENEDHPFVFRSIIPSSLYVEGHRYVAGLTIGEIIEAISLDWSW